MTVEHAKASASYKRTVRIGLWVVGGGLGIWLFFAFLFEPLLPFLLAALVAAFLQRPLGFLERRMRWWRGGRGVLSLLLVITVFGVLFALGAFLIGRLYGEGRELAVSFADNASAFAAMLDGVLRRISEFFASLSAVGVRSGDGGLLSSLIASFDAVLLELLQSAITAITARVPALLASVMAAMPRIFLFFTVWFMATLYLTPAWHDIGVWITKHFPEKSAAVLRAFKSTLCSTLMLYGRAYIILIFVTFTELYLGFSVLGIPYALGLSALIALIDILPVLGVGTVLLPWAVVLLIWGDVRLGILLLVLYAIISVVRQLLEPRIIGGQIGVHPLIALFSMYVGAALFGILGLFVLPIAAAIGVRYLREKGTG